MKSRFVIFSDNCASQYKSKLPFHHLSKLSNQFSIERCFFGERHGKSECDSCGGMVKAFLTRAALSNTALQNADEIVQFLNAKLSLRDNDCSHTVRQFHLIRSGQIDRRLKSSSLKTLSGTKKNHSLKVLDGQSVMTRQFSCFCTSCLQGNDCENLVKAFDVIRYDNAKCCEVSEPISAIESSAEGFECLNDDPILGPVEHMSQDLDQAFVVSNSVVETNTSLDIVNTCSLNSTSFYETDLNENSTSFYETDLNENTHDNGFLIESNENKINVDTPPTLSHQNISSPSPLKENNTSNVPLKIPCVRKRLFSSQLSRKDFFEITYKSFMSCNSFQELKLVCEDLTSQIQSFPFNIVPQSIIKNRLTVDKNALNQLPPSKPHGLLPVLTIGDGNCMPRAISTIVFGSSEHHREIRCRIVHELVTHMEDYLNPDIVSLGCDSEKSKVIPLIAYISSSHKGESTKDLNVCREIFMRETYEVRRLGEYMGMWQLLAVSNVLECAILSVYPNKGSTKLQKCFGRGLAPRVTRYDKPVFVFWTSSRRDMNEEWWVANHVFCLLINSHQFIFFQ